MKDEEIIIDGVDVSDCRLLDDYSKSMCNGFRADNSGFHQGYCLQNPNCYFKQLHRTKAQYNAVVEQIKSLQCELKQKKKSLMRLNTKQAKN